MKGKIFILTLLVISSMTAMAKTWQVLEDYTAGDGGSIQKQSSSGMDFTFLAVPASADYKFLYWIDGNTDNPRTFSASQTEDVLIRAVFAKKADVEAVVGSVDITVKDALIPSYALQAQVEECGVFVKWSNGSEQNPIIYTESMGTLTPVFRAGSPDQIVATYHQGDGGSIVGERVENTCNDYAFTAVPEDGYEFLYWSDGVTSAHRIYTYNGGTEFMRAVFGKTTDLHQTYGNTESQLMDNTIPSYQLTATPASCASLTQWNNGDTTASISYLETDGTRVPTFYARDMLEKHNDGVGGTVQVTQLVCGFTLTPVPETDYKFAYWEDGSTSALRDVDFLEEDYTATFVRSDVVASRGDVTYDNLQDAVNAGGDEPLYIISDATSQDIVVSTPITVYGGNHSIGNVTVLCGADLTLGDPITINNLFLNSTTGSSSQLHNTDHLTYSNAYIDVRLESTLTTASPNKWYAFAVPFDVNVQNGVSRQSKPDVALQSNRDFLIWEYDGQLRADTKGNGWKKLLAGTMVPGRFYMIGIDGTENVWRFKKSNGTLGGSSTLPVSQYASTDYKHAGWNALGNSLVTYANAACTGIVYAQVYDNASASGKYDVVTLSNMSFVMGSPFFIQAGANGSLLLTESTGGTLHAPSRNMSTSMLYEVTLSNATQQDRLYLTASEDAKDEYQIGKDVLKIMGGSQDSYIWATAYGNKLCAYDALWTGDDLEYTIGMSAASAGIYTLTVESTSNAEVYLMYQGMCVANLTESPYQLSLSKGNNNGYSLLVRGERKITTSLDVMGSADGGVYKTIEDAQLKIHVNDRIYNAQGNLMH